MTIPVQHHQSTQRSLYNVHVWYKSLSSHDLTLISTYATTREHLVLSITHGHHCQAPEGSEERQTRPGPLVSGLPPPHQPPSPLLCWASLPFHGGRRVEPVPSLPSMTGNWLPVLGLYRFTCVWRILRFFIRGRVVDYQLSKSSTKTLRHLQKWNKTLQW